MKFFLRESEHIQEDIKRGWSSWNFGQDGVKATEDEFRKIIESVTKDSPLYISGFYLYPNDIKKSEFGQLYLGYWVLIDTEHGLAASSFEANSIKEAIEKMSRDLIDFGEGDWGGLPIEEVELIHSKDDLHLFGYKENNEITIEKKNMINSAKQTFLFPKKCPVKQENPPKGAEGILNLILFFGSGAGSFVLKNITEETLINAQREAKESWILKTLGIDPMGISPKFASYPITALSVVGISGIGYWINKKVGAWLLLGGITGIVAQELFAAFTKKEGIEQQLAGKYEKQEEVLVKAGFTASKDKGLHLSNYAKNVITKIESTAGRTLSVDERNKVILFTNSYADKMTDINTAAKNIAGATKLSRGQVESILKGGISEENKKYAIDFIRDGIKSVASKKHRGNLSSSMKEALKTSVPDNARMALDKKISWDAAATRIARSIELSKDAVVESIRGRVKFMNEGIFKPNPLQINL
jgi:hypothetical protein